MGWLGRGTDRSGLCGESDLVAGGVQTMKLPLTESKLQKADASGNQTTVIKPANRGPDAAATLIKVGHEIGLDCVKRARPVAAAATTEDDYEFVPLSGGRRKGAWNDPPAEYPQKKTPHPGLAPPEPIPRKWGSEQRVFGTRWIGQNIRTLLSDAPLGGR